MQVSTFPWSTLIIAGAPVVASLGAVWIKGLYDDRAQIRQAEQASADAASTRRSGAYIELGRLARFWQSAALEIKAEFGGAPRDYAIDRSAILVRDLTQAVALVELIGSRQARAGAREIYKAAMSVGAIYSDWLSQSAAARKDPSAPVPEFDDHAATEKLGMLDAAITEFSEITSAEIEPDQTPQASPTTS